MKTPAVTNAQTGFFEEVDVLDSTGQTPKFKGTSNPRELRLLALLLRRASVPREQVDSEVGCSNGPDLVSRVRELGLGDEHLCCTRIRVIDRDGNVCRPGVYHLSAAGRRAVLRWFAKRKLEL
ncbi:MAG TPA: hypothetical protein PLL92_07060 [Alicycliphilus sp.]|nr:hypothetical protein [Alicycliphilus sp.]